MGFEAMTYPANSGENQQIPAAGGAKASLQLSPPMPADADLRAVAEAWPSLPAAIRAGIVAMVSAARQSNRGEADERK